MKKTKNKKQKEYHSFCCNSYEYKIEMFTFVLF